MAASNRQQVTVGEMPCHKGRHLESAFIESLRKKYPKACNRSLTNLSVIGLSTVGDPADNNAPVEKRASRKLQIGQSSPLSVSTRSEALSNFSKGLSSSQPDLLKASDLSFTSAGVDIDVPTSPQTNNSLGRWNTSMSGLHLLKKQGCSTVQQTAKLKPSLSTANIHERLRESKLRMNDLANKITVISRSNMNLLDIDSVTQEASNASSRPLTPSKALMTLSPSTTKEIDFGEHMGRSLAESPVDLDSDEVDDSAPVTNARKTQASIGEKASKLRTQPKSLPNLSSARRAEAPKSSSEAKDRLEELRARLTQKCESLQKRREALYSKMKANNITPERTGTLVPQRDNAEVERDSSSIPLDSVDHVKQQALQKVEVNSTTREGHAPLAPKKSGTDSDGDSGIDLSLKRHKITSKNSLAPKLRKYNGASSLSPRPGTNVDASPRQREDCLRPAARLTPPAEDVSDQSESISPSASQSTPSSASITNQSLPSTKTSSMNLAQSQPSIDPTSVPSLRQSVSTSSILKGSVSSHPSPHRSESLKSVRFSTTADVIENTTPRMIELSDLAENAAYNYKNDTFLQDTALDGFESDSSDFSSDESGRSTPDMTGIDPRIAQLALGVRNYSKQLKQEPSKASTSVKQEGENQTSNTQTDDEDSPRKAVPRMSSSGWHSNGPAAVREMDSRKSQLTSPRVNVNGSPPGGNDHPTKNRDIVNYGGDLKQSPRKPDRLKESGSVPTVMSPPKPPRLSQSEENLVGAVAKSTLGYTSDTSVSKSPRSESSNPSTVVPVSAEYDDTVQPYAIVDTSAFHKQKVVPGVANSKQDKKSKIPKRSSSSQVVDRKPPLPKSSPPKSSPSGSVSSLHKQSVSAEENTYEDVAPSKATQNKSLSSPANKTQVPTKTEIDVTPVKTSRQLPSSRRSRLDKQDFDPPYSYSEKRPSRSQLGSDSDWESIMTEDDRSSRSSRQSSIVSSPVKPKHPVNKPSVSSDASETGSGRPSRSTTAHRPQEGAAERGQRPSSVPAQVNRSGIPSEFSKPPRRTEDLWGSNASLHSSQSNLGGSMSSLSGSRSSLFERVGSFKQAAKKKIKSIKRSLSLDRLNSPKDSKQSAGLPPPAPLSKSKKSPKSKKDEVATAGTPTVPTIKKSPTVPTIKKSPTVPTIKKSLSWKSLDKLKFSKKSSYAVDQVTGDVIPNAMKRSTPKKPMIGSPLATSPSASSVESPNHFRAIGKMLEVSADGCQIIQLNRPPHGPYGFYIGQSKDVGGYFVTRLSDSYAEKLFCGLLCVGDEILKVNGLSTARLSIDEIHDTISKSDKLILKVKSNNSLNSNEWF